MALNARQIRFIQEYKLSRNATDAVIKAGYSPKGASVAGHNLLKRPDIKKIIEESQEKDLKVLSSPSVEQQTIPLPTKTEYVLKAWERTSDDSTLKEETKYKYFENAGRALGHLNNDEPKTVTNNLTLNKIEVTQLPQGMKWETLRGMLEND